MRRKPPHAVILGQRISALRKPLGSQQWLADKLGVHQATVAHWECGYQAPHDKYRAAIARVLGTDYTALWRIEPTNGDEEAA